MNALRPLGIMLGLALASAPALAVPVEYALLEGSQVNASLWLNGEAIAADPATLDGGSIVFDAETGAVSMVSLQSGSVSLYASDLPGAYNWIDVAISVSSSEDGSLTTAFEGFLADVNEPSTAEPQPLEGIAFTDEVVVEYEVGADGTVRIALRGVKLAELIVGDDVFVLRGDVKVIGTPVPEPATAAMLLSGLVGLAALGTRKH
ncbi:MAG TPA: PEP-CTERM sorting domain-containing protein [Myxococcota bacterium]|nr:PEP-CTERM sorting domain-containing protein [Myxococcota bacterium]